MYGHLDLKISIIVSLSKSMETMVAW